MKGFFSLLRADLRRAFVSKRFLFSVCGVTLICFLLSWGFIIMKTSHSDVLYFLETSSGSEGVVLTLGILPVLPFAITYASDWEERANDFWIIRAGTRSYSLCEVIVSALSGILTTVAGMLLFVLLLRLKFPLFKTITTGDAYVSLLKAGRPVAYLFCYIFHLSLSSALFAVAALWISTYIPSRFAAVAGPLALYFLLFRLMTQLPIPEFLKINVIVKLNYNAGSVPASLLLKLGSVAVLCLLMGYGTVRQIKRRVQRD